MAAMGLVSGFFSAHSIHAVRRGNTADILTPPPPASPEAAPKTRGPSPFTWSQLESDDIQEYIANLRKLGCPARTIGDLVHAKVYAMYQARVNALFNPLAKYWSTTEEMKAIDGQVKAIREERDKFWAGLQLEVSGFDPSSALGPEKQVFVAEALKRYPKAEPQPNWGAQDWQSFIEARKARVNLLAEHLTPDELYDYRVSQDGGPSGIARLLWEIKPSDAEFRRVFEALDGENLSTTNGMLASGLQYKLQQALGDERYAEYLQQQSSPDHPFNLFAMTYNLSDDQIQQLKQLRAQAETMSPAAYRQAAAGILSDPSAIRRFMLLSGKPMDP
jgi:hypothetical protein